MRPSCDGGAELKIRAERQAGMMLSEMPKLSGVRGTGKKVDSHDARPLLSDLGLTWSDSSRWQRMMKLPEAGFVESMAGD